MDAPIGLFAPDGTTALLEFPHQAGMGCRAALHANQVPQSLLDLDFNPSMQQLGQNVLPVFDSLVFF